VVLEIAINDSWKGFLEIMPKHSLNIIVVLCLMMVLTTASVNVFAEEEIRCPERISDEEIFNIVDMELKRRNENFNRNYDSEREISREGCWYVYFERFIPPKPGEHFTFLINEKGEVDTIIPGR
jgi:hypothetical protein